MCCPYHLVGARGFEPPAPCSQSRCSTRLSYAPNRRPFTASRSGTPGEGRKARGFAPWTRTRACRPGPSFYLASVQGGGMARGRNSLQVPPLPEHRPNRWWAGASGPSGVQGQSPWPYFLHWHPTPAYTLKRNSSTSPSLTTYSLPSTRILPASLAPCSPLQAT